MKTKITLEDTGFVVTGNEFEWHFKHHTSFDECVKMLLTKSQWRDFLGFETHRTFQTTSTKVDFAWEWINDNNIELW